MWRKHTAYYDEYGDLDFGSIEEEAEAGGDISVVHNIRSLTLRTKYDLQGLHDAPRRILDLLEIDQLHEFTIVTQTPLDWRNMLHLLDNQRKLRSFRAPVDVGCHRNHWLAESDVIQPALFVANARRFIPPAMRMLKELRIHIRDDERAEHGLSATALVKLEAEYNSLQLKAATQLDCLEICAWPWKEIPRDRTIPLRNLTKHGFITSQDLKMPNNLVLAGLDLEGMADTLVTALPVSTLTSLRLKRCGNVEPLLHGLAAAFRREKAGALHTLAISTPWIQREEDMPWDAEEATTTWTPEEVKKSFQCALDELIASFQSLEHLEIAPPGMLPKEWVRYLAQHNRLRRIQITSPTYSKYDALVAEWLKALLEACPKLTDFACNGHGSLDDVATAPSLRTLRLLYPVSRRKESGMDPPRDPKYTRDATEQAQRTADHAVAHLHSKGSRIRRLLLSPEKPWNYLTGYDYYPDLCFEPCITRVDGEDLVCAVRIPDNDVEVEFPELKAWR
jgi:hypothetical protein